MKNLKTNIIVLIVSVLIAAIGGVLLDLTSLVALPIVLLVSGSLASLCFLFLFLFKLD